jgi:type I restriction enzyme S subunit
LPTKGPFFVTAAQIGDGHAFFNECSCLNWSKAKKLRKGWALRGGLVLTHNATVGRFAIVEDVDPFLLGTSMTHYRTNQSVLLNRFLYWLFCAPVFQDQLNAINRNSGRTESTMHAPTKHPQSECDGLPLVMAMATDQAARAAQLQGSRRPRPR